MVWPRGLKSFRGAIEDDWKAIWRQDTPFPPRVIPNHSPSFPLYSTRRFARHVIDDAVDAFDFVDDAGRYARQEAVLEGIIIRRHAVGGGHGAKSADMVIGAAI